MRSYWLLLLLCLGCQQDAQWKEARANYCQSLANRKIYTRGELQGVLQSIRSSEGESPERLAVRCRDLSWELRTIKASLDGFSKLPDALRESRKSGLSADEAGIPDRLLITANLHKFVSASGRLCEAGKHAELLEQFANVNSEILSNIDRGLKACKAVGALHRIP